MTIYVGNLSFQATEDSIRNLFAEYGEVSSARVITDKFTGKSRGFGFVEMPDDEAARKAIAELDGGRVEDRTIKVTEARPREERSGSGGGEKRSFSRNNSYNRY